MKQLTVEFELVPGALEQAQKILAGRLVRLRVKSSYAPPNPDDGSNHYGRQFRSARMIEYGPYSFRFMEMMCCAGIIGRLDTRYGRGRHQP